MRTRKIVGYHAGDTLETEGCLRALERAVKELVERPCHENAKAERVNGILKQE
ncbi:MAG: hypothetical protein PWQ29_1486 [Verrucomicrobiota bacterium]|jgi:hypothetical protein|nr:hypothetical protein [Verrucomicrobiota bacterium]MDK2964092.1 hypothetical protein [Verrucomicrobiota bacterium]